VASGKLTVLLSVCQGILSEPSMINLSSFQVQLSSNLAASIPFESSKLYAKNLYNFVKYAVQSGKLNTADDLVKPMLLTHEGKVLYGL
jgi:NAD/NADP transhydrogenase alpha subunit